MYATYAGDSDPSELIREGRTELAARLIVESGLDQKAAYYAADQILRVATENIDRS